MTIEMLEAAVDALSTYLQANMPAKVVELNTRYSDSVALVDPTVWYIGSYPHSIPEQPSVALVALDWTPELQRQANIDGMTRIDITVFVGGAELEPRFRALARYSVGMVELLKAGKAEMGYSKVMLAGVVALTEVMDTPDFLQAVIVPAALSKTEEY